MERHSQGGVSIVERVKKALAREGLENPIKAIEGNRDNSCSTSSNRSRDDSNDGEASGASNGSAGVIVAAVSSKDKKDKKDKIAEHFREIMKLLDLDVEEESVADTPMRVAKMYVDEMFSGLDYANFPAITTQSNSFEYVEPVQVDGIAFTTTCEHHFITFDGFVSVAYLPADRLIGLSKINRIVRFFAQRPQVQERFTRQILVTLQTILETQCVAVYANAVHFCVKARGVMDQHSSTTTTAFGGRFLEDPLIRSTFMQGATKLRNQK